MVEKVIEDLHEMGDPRAVKIWARLKMDTEFYLGCGLTKLKNYAKKIKKNHQLSQELWKSKYRDARLLSLFIADPKQFTKEMILEYGRNVDFWDMSDSFCSFIIAKTKYGPEIAQLWRHSNSELEKRSAFIIVSQIAKKSKEMEDIFFEVYLNQIHEEILTDKNWVREGMLYAMIAIGSRNISLNKQTLTISDAVGKIDIDYGESSCMAPDPQKSLRSQRLIEKLGAV